MNALATGVTTASRVAFPIATSRPYPNGLTYEEIAALDPYSLSSDYFLTNDAGAQNMLSGVSGESGVNVSYQAQIAAIATAGAVQNLGFVYDPVARTYKVIRSGRTGQTVFGPANLISDTAEQRLYARTALFRNEVREEAFLVRRNGAGTLLPNNRYVTNGFFATGFGSTGAYTASDERYYFTAGSPTKDADVPTTGTVTYTVARFEGDAYQANSRYPVTGSATIVADFALRKITLTLSISIASAGRLTNPRTHEVVLNRFNSASNFLGSNTANRIATTAWAQVFGPGAREIGIGFGYIDELISDSDVHVHISGSIVGYAQ